MRPPRSITTRGRSTARPSSSGVDEVIKRGYIDEENMFVTGGGGGVLTCWVIGRTDRFAAAASQYPVINWYSFVLTWDMTAYVHKRWFKGYPWETVDDHMKRSPISLVGKVTTPCLLITGELDWRTPISASAPRGRRRMRKTEPLEPALDRERPFAPD